MAKKYLDDNGLLYFWGKIKATFALISHTHTKSEITDFPSTMTPSSHTHGNITNAGALQTTDVAIATGDKLVITDASNSSKVARASLTFDGSTATKALTQKGTFETFLTSADVPEGASASTTTPAMDGTATAGTETSFARGDHVHPTDTSRAPLASPALTGTPTAPTAATGTTTTQIATTEFVANTVGAMTSGVSDVKVGGTSVVTSGIANINGSETAASGGTTLSMVTTGEKYTWNNKANGNNFTGPSSASVNGTKGLVPAPSKSFYTARNHTVLTANGDWQTVTMTTEASPTDASKQRIGVQFGSTTTYTTPTDATSSMNGFMSATDKAKLDSITMNNGVIDASVLPSFVDDVIEAYPRSGQTELGSAWLSATSGGSALTPETGKIYVLMADSTSYAANSQFRWGGTAYVKLSDGGVSSITNAEIDAIVAS